MRTKLYIYAAILIIVLSLVSWGTLTRKQLIKARAENIRYQYNQQQLLDKVNEYKRIVVTREELISSLTREQDSLMRELKIKPKQVERIVERWHYSVDTTQKAQLLASNDSLKRIIEDNLSQRYPFLDQAGCFIFGGSVAIDQGLRLEVTRREYTNRSTEIAYLEREKKFLFIRYGPWRGKLFVDNECGEDQVKELTVVKR